jgi:electron transport complex protein RnfG
MREMIKLLAVVLIFSAVSGGLLAALYGGTLERIEYQELLYVRGPALKQVMQGSSNDPLTDRFKLADGEEERAFYVGVFDGKANVVAFESFGKGYEDEIGVIVGVNLETDKIVGIGITTNKETPGVGKRIETDSAFKSQFEGLPIKDPFKIRGDGGQVDAVSGASFSSRGVCGALNESAEIYMRLKADILEKMKAFQA